MKPLHACLWFTNQARPAAEFYCSVFPNSKITTSSPMVVYWEMNGQKFMCLNDAPPKMKFNDSISFVITCDDQKEIDYYWARLTSDGGAENMCGWCVDKFGVSWQVVPAILGELMSDPQKGPRVIQAFLKMKKFDIEKLKNA